jgi:hypothetical protein
MPQATAPLSKFITAAIAGMIAALPDIITIDAIANTYGGTRIVRPIMVITRPGTAPIVPVNIVTSRRSMDNIGDRASAFISTSNLGRWRAARWPMARSKLAENQEALLRTNTRASFAAACK